jgi:hypothetical protein
MNISVFYFVTQYIDTYHAGRVVGRHGWPALQNSSRPLTNISYLSFIRRRSTNQKKFGAPKEAARDCTLSVCVTVTFFADQAARKESRLSDVQVEGVKAYAVQEAEALGCSMAGGAAKQDENIEQTQAERNI